MESSREDSASKWSIRNLGGGNWITLVAGVLFIISLFTEWWGGFFIYEGRVEVFTVGTSHASGLPMLAILAFVAAIGCMLLCIPFLKEIEGKWYMGFAGAQVVLALLGLVPFIMSHWELQEWSPPGELKGGGWFAIITIVLLLIGAIATFVRVRGEVAYSKHDS